MPLRSPLSAIIFLFPSAYSSSYSSFSPCLRLHSRNGAATYCCINGGWERISMSVYDKKGIIRLRPFSTLAFDVSAVEDPLFMSTSVGSPPPSLFLSRWNLGPRHILLLNIIACTAAISTLWLFFSAIPTIKAFRREAESLEKLFDVTTEELPDTMAAIRLSGMEISDLTMELSDLGQEITRGVRSSTRAVRVAEERLRHLTTMDPTVPTQEHNNSSKEMARPQLAKTARDLREGIAKGRVLFGAVFGFSQFSRWAWRFFASPGRRR